MPHLKRTVLLTVMGFGIGSILGLSGCDRKEKVLDIETPAGEIEIERDKDTGALDVDVDDKPK